MKTNPRQLPFIVLLMGIVAAVGMLLISPATASSKASSKAEPTAIRPDRAVFGMTYGDWSAVWWQYVLSIPAADNPLTDFTGQNCGLQQSSGLVFFLVGTLGGEEVERHCIVPAGKTIFFPIVHAECSTLEDPPFFGGNEAELRACAARWANGIGMRSLQVTVDGNRIKPLGKFRVQSPVFDITLPEDNIIGLPPGKGSSVSDGYFVMLAPLSPGDHLIHYEGTFVSGAGEGFKQNVTYHITVTH